MGKTLGVVGTTMKRQGLKVSMEQLQNLLIDLETQTRKNIEDFNLSEKDYEELEHKQWQINIINKSGDSDGWEIENGI